MQERIINLNKSILTILSTIFFMFIAFNTNVFATDSDVVNIPDIYFKQLLNKQLGVTNTSADITEGQLKSINALHIVDYDIKDITGIEYCINLKEVSFDNCSNLTNISSIGKLPNLEKLSINFCSNLTNISSIGELSDLENLSISLSRYISDFTCISKLSNLENLELCGVKLTDISFLSNLTNLKHLDLRDNYLTNITSLKNLKLLDTLNISNNEIVDISALGSLTNLTVLIMNSNYIKDINSLKNLTKLCELNLSWNKSIEDISAIKNLTNLNSLNISQIKVTNIFPIYGLQNLKHLEMDNIRINDSNEDTYYKTISSLVNLEYLSVENCGIPDECTTMLTCLKNLKTLGFDLNNISDFSFLSKLPKLDFEYAINSPINFLIYEEIKLPVSGTECRIINTVKDVNGNYVIPEVTVNDDKYYEAGTSSFYRYDSAFNEIIIDISEFDNPSQIELRYNFTNNVNGNTFGISNKKLIQIDYYEPHEAKLTSPDIVNGRKWYNGDKITLQTIIENGSGRFDYRYYLVNHATNETVLISKYNNSGYYECTLNPSLYGDISFYAEIIDIDGRMVKTNSVTINVHNLKLYGNDMESSIGKLNLYEGNKLQLNAVYKNAPNNCTYKFEKFNLSTGKSTLLKDFSTNNSFEYTLNEVGSFKYLLTIKYANGSTKEANPLYVDVNPGLKATLQVGGSTSVLTKVKGSKITLNAVASGGSGNYTYKIAVLNADTGKWTVLRISMGASYTYSLDYTGTKQFAVTVKDSAGNTVATNRITVKVVLPLAGKLQVNGSASTLTKVKGSKITLNAIGSGGSGNYTYKFAVLNVSTRKWTVLRDFSTNASYTYALNYGGTKQFAVTVKDSAGKTVATNRITVNVKG